MGFAPISWNRSTRLGVGVAATVVLAVTATTPAWAGGAWWGHGPQRQRTTTTRARARTPIQHVVVIFDENISFDHYFGTYPKAANTDGTTFRALPRTPKVNGLTSDLLTNNPNSYNPDRLTHEQALTCDQDHGYGHEQLAYDGGKADKFVQYTNHDTCTGAPVIFGEPGLVMDYYDGNTVTGLWNYAQHYAMSDNSFGTTFGPSSPGAINLVSGDTGSVDMTHTANNPSIATAAKPNADLTPDGHGGYSVTSDPQPFWDDCSTRDAVAMSGQNIGDKLNTAGLSWGFFQGGYRPTTSFTDALTATGHSGQSTATFTPNQFKNGGFQTSVPHSSNQGICNAVHPIGAGLSNPLTPGTGQYGYKDDYIPHHQPFNYYASTANPHHLTLPTDEHGTVNRRALKTIGTDTQHYVNGTPQFDTPNHQYDSSDFDQLVAGIAHGDLPPSALPAVSFLKAPGYQDGHAAYSDPLDEQQFLATEINALMKTPDWANTAVVVNYDDSDGWYDHAYSGVTNPSQSVADALTGPGQCATATTTTPLAGQQGRCGYGPRLPLVLVSPWAKANYIDHTRTDQSSITRFIEDNWKLGRISGSFDSIAGSLNGLLDLTKPHGEAPNERTLLLDPATGQPAPEHPEAH
jgi:phospholipase C